jgi:hypothetical protein
VRQFVLCSAVARVWTLNEHFVQASNYFPHGDRYRRALRRPEVWEYWPTAGQQLGISAFTAPEVYTRATRWRQVPRRIYREIPAHCPFFTAPIPAGTVVRHLTLAASVNFNSNRREVFPISLAACRGKALSFGCDENRLFTQRGTPRCDLAYETLATGWAECRVKYATLSCLHARTVTIAQPCSSGTRSMVAPSLSSKRTVGGVAVSMPG